VWLGKEEEQGYYYGFANEGLWPLCHIAHTRPIVRADDWQHYQQVNRKFTDAVLEEIGDTPGPVILVQGLSLRVAATHDQGEAARRSRRYLLAHPVA
jgi:trehalose 6-phosphate synthase